MLCCLIFICNLLAQIRKSVSLLSNYSIYVMIFFWEKIVFSVCFVFAVLYSLISNIFCHILLVSSFAVLSFYLLSLYPGKHVFLCKKTPGPFTARMPVQKLSSKDKSQSGFGSKQNNPCKLTTGLKLSESILT